MTHKVYIVTDLGPGDGGKGGVVHAVSRNTRAHTIIKRGGAQGSHGVQTSKGERFNFSQWGCGTFEGIPTFLSEQMIISPEGLLNEAADLRYGHGIIDPFSLLTVDERCLVATPFHGIASRLKELARGDDPRGTVGTGVGEAYRMSNRTEHPVSIFARDLGRPGLKEKLAHVREAVRSELEPVLRGRFNQEDTELLNHEVGLLGDDGFLDHVARRFEQAAEVVAIVHEGYLEEEILPRAGVAVIETSHGILTDRLVGFHPHTSAIRTLPGITRQLLVNAGFDGEVVNLGVTRAYAIRHGAGPLPTADPAMADCLLPGSAKDSNRYQGKVRVGPLDFVLLRCAIDVCGGPSAFDGLAVTWFDQIVANSVWHVCSRYEGAGDDTYFTRNGDIRVDVNADGTNRRFQAELGHKLRQIRPEITDIPLDGSSSKDSLYGICAETMQRALDIPVRMISFGPTERDKVCR